MPRNRREPAAERLAAAWEREAERWIAWAREPDHDSYWRFHRRHFLDLLPPPGRLALDLGCGEGRVGRDAAGLGYRVLGIDRAPSLLRAAAAAGSPPAALADAAALPFGSGTFDLVFAHMTLQDMDDMPGAVGEAARVLEPGGRLCLAVVHPLNSAGEFASRDDGAPFVIAGDYMHRRRYADAIEREGLGLTFHSDHWPLQGYLGAIEAAGLLVESVREIADSEGRWARVPLFLHARALKP